MADELQNLHYVVEMELGLEIAGRNMTQLELGLEIAAGQTKDGRNMTQWGLQPIHQQSQENHQWIAPLP